MVQRYWFTRCSTMGDRASAGNEVDRRQLKQRPPRPRFRSQDIAALAFLGGLAAGVTAILVWQVSSSPDQVPWGLVGGLAFVIVLLLGWGYLTAQFRDFSVQGDFLSLRLPIRLNMGAKVRAVPLDTIESAAAYASSAGDRGVKFRLKDGTEFIVFEADLSTRAASELNSLLRTLGRSTREGLAR